MSTQGGANDFGNLADQQIRTQRLASSRALASFLQRRDIAESIEPSGSDRTVVSDQLKGINYSLEGENYQRLLDLLDACRREGAPQHFSERQGRAVSKDTLLSGIMIDFDILTTNAAPALNDRQYTKLAHAIGGLLEQDLGLLADARFLMFFTVKPQALPAASGGAAGAAGEALFKYGFHILVPGLMVGRGYKKLLMHKLADHPTVLAVVRELGSAAPEKALDRNSASVPVLLFGSCKRSSTAPYVLGAVLELSVEEGMPVMIRRLAPGDYEGYNLVAEMSLVAEARYADGRAPLVAKQRVACLPAAARQAEDYERQTVGNDVDLAALVEAESELSTLLVTEPEAAELQRLLEILTPDYSEDYMKWRNVVFAIANTGERLRPLALWFSRRAPQKFDPAAFERLWGEAVARRGGHERPLTARSIAYWARECDPARYEAVMNESYMRILFASAIECNGQIGHVPVARLLRAMVGLKYCSDHEGSQRCWYVFVVPGQPMHPNEAWKWRREPGGENSELNLYMSDQLPAVYRRLVEFLEQRVAAANDEAQAKWLGSIVKNLIKSRVNLDDDRFKRCTLSQAWNYFRQLGFSERLDSDPCSFGVANGVLRLGPRCSLVSGYHEYPVSKFTPVPWKPFDPGDPMTRLVLDAIAAIFVERDARDWVLFHAAQGLSSGPKEGLFLLLEGGGQNGKTAFLRWVAAALGPYGEKFNVQMMCGGANQESVDRPNSALMRFQHINWAYGEETDQTSVLNTRRFKELNTPGEVSCRDLNERQKTFRLHCNIVVASQYSFVMKTTDHALWRRWRTYRMKTKFRKNHDPANPFEREDDQRFIREMPENIDFKSSMLSILCHYYERLLRDYGGELKNVPCPTIERETEEFRRNQDSLHKWISMVAVVTPNSDAKIPLNEVAESYVSWYVQHVMTQGGRPALNNVMKEIESSAMSKFLQPQVNGTLALHRVRLVGPGGNLVLAPGEEMLVNVEARGGRPDRQPEPVTPHWWEGADSGAGVEPFLRDPPTTGCVAGCSVAEDDRRMLLAAAGRA